MSVRVIPYQSELTASASTNQNQYELSIDKKEEKQQLEEECWSRAEKEDVDPIVAEEVEEGKEMNKDNSWKKGR